MRIKHKYLLLFILPLPISGNIQKPCDFNGDFFNISLSADLVGQFKLIEQKKNYIYIEPIEIIKGDNSKEILKIKYTNFKSCNPCFNTTFNLDSLYILGLFKDSDSTKMDYYIGNCGQSYLYYHNGFVIGMINCRFYLRDCIDTIKYDTFKEELIEYLENGGENNKDLDKIYIKEYIKE